MSEAGFNNNDKIFLSGNFESVNSIGVSVNDPFINESLQSARESLDDPISRQLKPIGMRKQRRSNLKMSKWGEGTSVQPASYK